MDVEVPDGGALKTIENLKSEIANLKSEIKRLQLENQRTFEHTIQDDTAQKTDDIGLSEVADDEECKKVESENAKLRLELDQLKITHAEQIKELEKHCDKEENYAHDSFETDGEDIIISNKTKQSGLDKQRTPYGFGSSVPRGGGKRRTRKNKRKQKYTKKSRKPKRRQTRRR